MVENKNIVKIWFSFYIKQAGLSRATLENYSEISYRFSSGFFSNFPLRPYVIFYIYFKAYNVISEVSEP